MLRIGYVQDANCTSASLIRANYSNERPAKLPQSENRENNWLVFSIVIRSSGDLPDPLRLRLPPVDAKHS
jgi:hypothetical protein